MNKRLVSLKLHGFDHAECGQRVDEAGRGFDGRCAVIMDQTSCGRHADILRIRGARGSGDHFPHQCLCGGVVTSGDDCSCSFVAHGYGHVQPRANHAQALFWHRRHKGWLATNGGFLAVGDRGRSKHGAHV